VVLADDVGEPTRAQPLGERNAGRVDNRCGLEQIHCRLSVVIAVVVVNAAHAKKKAGMAGPLW
jgi:hypothetical protein